MEINFYNSMKELKQEKRKLENLLFDKQDDINLVVKLNNINDLISNILNQKKTNMEWLDILSRIVNNRKYKYSTMYLSGVRNNIKWNVYMLVRDDINIHNIAKDEAKGVIFMAPDLFSEYYSNDEFVIYDTFYGNSPLYLDKKKCVFNFIKKARISGLKEEEINELYEILFNDYKKESSKNEKIRRI